jgi:hypothetical protein
LLRRRLPPGSAAPRISVTGANAASSPAVFQSVGRTYSVVICIPLGFFLSIIFLQSDEFKRGYILSVVPFNGYFIDDHCQFKGKNSGTVLAVKHFVQRTFLNAAVVTSPEKAALE